MEDNSRADELRQELSAALRDIEQLRADDAEIFTQEFMPLARLISERNLTPEESEAFQNVEFRRNGIEAQINPERFQGRLSECCVC